VVGRIEVLVTDRASFLVDVQVKKAMEYALSIITGAPQTFIAVTLASAPAEVQSSSGYLPAVLSYTITIPYSTGGYQLGERYAAAIAAHVPASMGMALLDALAHHASAQVYELIVADVSQPAVHSLQTLTTTATSAVQPAAEPLSESQLASSAYVALSASIFGAGLVLGACVCSPGGAIARQFQADSCKAASTADFKSVKDVEQLSQDAPVSLVCKCDAKPFAAKTRRSRGWKSASQLDLEIGLEARASQQSGDASAVDNFWGLWYEDGDALKCWAIKHSGKAFFNGRTSDWSFAEEQDESAGGSRLIPRGGAPGIEIDMHRSDPHQRVVWTQAGKDIAVWYRSKAPGLDDSMDESHADPQPGAETCLESVGGLWYLDGDVQKCRAIKPTGEVLFNGQASPWNFVQEVDRQNGENRLVVPHLRQQSVEVDWTNSNPRSRLVFTKHGEEVASWYRLKACPTEASGAPRGEAAKALRRTCSNLFDDDLLSGSEKSSPRAAGAFAAPPASACGGEEAALPPAPPPKRQQKKLKKQKKQKEQEDATSAEPAGREDASACADGSTMCIACVAEMYC